MDFGTFTLITGVASLLGFMLQIRDAFPKHREVRKTILLVIFGVFIGTLLGSFQNITIFFNLPLTGFNLLVGFTSFVLAALVIVGALSEDKEKRNDIFSISGGGALLLVLILAFGSIDDSGSNNRNNKLTADELMILVDVNIDKGNIDRSILLLQQIKSKLRRDDPRYAILEKKINILKNSQFGSAK